ncbi:Uncharacterised protein [Helicobacter canis]|uniref:Uncharacterized protein n=1 Tax=Helicobacter canis TaxID=29419 RepID=A0A377JN23_9HELI|nr:Uncharacterised protein [Helicobacter canis]
MLGVGFLLVDSAFGLESWISSPRGVDRRPSLISLRGSKSPDSISKILESFGCSPTFAAFLESTFPSACESFKFWAVLLSLRADCKSAWQSIFCDFSKLDSRFVLWIATLVSLARDDGKRGSSARDDRNWECACEKWAELESTFSLCGWFLFSADFSHKA